MTNEFKARFKFAIGEKVVIKGNSNIGEVTGRKFELSSMNGKEIQTTQYFVKYANFNCRWFTEVDLDEYVDHTTDISDKDYEAITKLLIDVHLDRRNFAAVKELTEELHKKVK